MTEERKDRPEPQKEPPRERPRQHEESTYAVEEAIAGGAAFDSSPEEVAAALHAADLREGHVTEKQVKEALRYLRRTPVEKLGQKEE